MKVDVINLMRADEGPWGLGEGLLIFSNYGFLISPCGLNYRLYPTFGQAGWRTDWLYDFKTRNQGSQKPHQKTLGRFFGLKILENRDYPQIDKKSWQNFG